MSQQTLEHFSERLDNIRETFDPNTAAVLSQVTAVLDKHGSVLEKGLKKFFTTLKQNLDKCADQQALMHQLDQIFEEVKKHDNRRVFENSFWFEIRSIHNNNANNIEKLNTLLEKMMSDKFLQYFSELLSKKTQEEIIQGILDEANKRSLDQATSRAYQASVTDGGQFGEMVLNVLKALILCIRADYGENVELSSTASGNEPSARPKFMPLTSTK